MRCIHRYSLIVVLALVMTGYLAGVTAVCVMAGTTTSSGDWENAATWDTPPGTTDAAVLKGGHTITFDDDSGDQTVASISGRDATLNISGSDTLRANGTVNLAWGNQTVVNQSGATFSMKGLNLVTTSNGPTTVDYTLSGGTVHVDEKMMFGSMCCGASIRTAQFTISNNATLDVGGLLQFAGGYYGGSLNEALPTFTVIGSTPTIDVGGGLLIIDQMAVTSAPKLEGFTTLDFQADTAGVSPINITGSVTLADVLDVDLSAYTTDASEILLIDNDGTDSIAGAFSTVNILPSVSGKTYAVSYAGGSGNDLTLISGLTWDGTDNNWGSAHWDSGSSTIAPSDGLGMIVHGGTSTVVGTHAPYSLEIDGGTVTIGATGDLSMSLLDVSGIGSLTGTSGGSLAVSDVAYVGAAIDVSGLTVDLSTATVNLTAPLTGDADMTVTNLNVNTGGTMDLGDSNLTVTNKLALTSDLDMSGPGMGALTVNDPAEVSIIGPATLTLDNAVTPSILTMTDGGAVALAAGGSIEASDKYALRKVTSDLDLGGSAELIVGIDGSTNTEWVILEGTNSYTGRTEINRSILRTSNPGNVLNIGDGHLEFSSNDNRSPAILETSGTIARTIGTADGQIYWQERGGFAAFGDDLTVTLTRGDGATAPLDWSSGTNGFRGRHLQMGTPTATHAATLTNDIEMDGNKTIFTSDNNNAPTDISIFSGDITQNNATKRTLMKDGKGILWLAGETVSYTGMTTIKGGNSTNASVLRAVDPDTATYNLTSTERIKFDQGTLETTGDLDFDLGNSAGTVEFANHGGFSAWGPNGEDLTVTLNSGATINWGDSTTAGGLNGKELVMGSQLSNAAVFMTNDIDGGNSNRNIRVEDNPNSDADRTVFQGDLTNFNNLYINGRTDSGITEFAGSVTTNGLLKAQNKGELRITGTANPGTELQVMSNSTLSGTGTIDLNSGQKAYVNSGAFLAPGSDDIGTLTVQDALFEMRNGSAYQWEVLDPANTDTVHLSNGLLNLQDTWNLELFDAGVIAGVEPTDELLLFDYDATSELQLNGTTQSDATRVEITNFNLVGLPPDGWDTSNVHLWYDQSATGGRVYMDGLFITALAVPEPSTLTLLLLGVLVLSQWRRRHFR